MIPIRDDLMDPNPCHGCGHSYDVLLQIAVDGKWMWLCHECADEVDEVTDDWGTGTGR